MINLAVFASRPLGAQPKHRDGTIRAMVNRPERASNSERTRRNPPLDALRASSHRNRGKLAQFAVNSPRTSVQWHPLMPALSSWVRFKRTKNWSSALP
jgi:hypothetical protein